MGFAAIFMNCKRTFVYAALAALCIPARAQDQAEIIRQLFERIDKLEKRVSELEGQKRRQSLLPRQRLQQPPHPGGIHEPPPAPEAGATTPTMKMTGFGDVVFAAADQRQANNGFSEGQFILHIASALSPKVTYFGEISLTARTDAGTGVPPATGFNAEVERTIIRYDHNDRLKVSFGRYHTPVNYWNTAFHHGAWLQTTISRPEMTQFGGSFIPVHFIGGLVEGAVPAGGLNLNYNVGVGNGRSSVLSRGETGATSIPTARGWPTSSYVPTACIRCRSALRCTAIASIPRWRLQHASGSDRRDNRVDEGVARIHS